VYLFQEKCNIVLSEIIYKKNVSNFKKFDYREMSMKKLVVAVLLGLMLCTAGAFADHPNGWGVGLLGQYGGSWSGSGGLGGAAVSLKAPSVPVFWGINLGFPSNGFLFGVTGDYYLVDQYLIQQAGFGWFLGIGGYFDFATYTYTYGNKDYSQTALGLGARVPIGLSWRPIDFFELFIDFAPSLGILFYSGNYYDYWKDESKIAFGGGWQGDIGLRFWF
jgi:hypothetical protein